jgi:hypothetical protein
VVVLGGELVEVVVVVAEVDEVVDVELGLVELVVLVVVDCRVDWVVDVV